jgi:hypothetical protein
MTKRAAHFVDMFSAGRRCRGWETGRRRVPYSFRERFEVYSTHLISDTAATAAEAQAHDLGRTALIIIAPRKVRWARSSASFTSEPARPPAFASRAVSRSLYTSRTGLGVTALGA